MHFHGTEHYTWYMIAIVSCMNAIIQVIFVGEEGEDTGGLRREFWRLFALQAVDQYCIGDAHKTFLQNVPALQVSL